MAIYTSTINYSGDLRKLDITVKSSGPFGRRFAPTWPMVMNYKKTNNMIIYKDKYRDIIESNYYYVKQLAEIASKEDIVLLCYCRANTFCHRVILANYIQDVFKVKYKNEI